VKLRVDVTAVLLEGLFVSDIRRSCAAVDEVTARQADSTANASERLNGDGDRVNRLLPLRWFERANHCASRYASW
jgi:hypothetical protein